MPLFWLGIFISLISLILRKKKLFDWFIAASILWLFMISTSFIPNILIASLENNYFPLTKPEVEKDTTYIVILGAGFTDDQSLTPNNQLSTAALGRVVEGIRIHRLVPNSKLVFSGSNGKSSISQAEVMKRTAKLLGVDSNKVLLMPYTLNTRDEAETFSNSYGPSDNLILITDAAHMLRAIKYFEKFGNDPEPAPTNFLIKKGSKKNYYSWFPSARNLRKTEIAMHEWIGLIIQSLTQNKQKS